MNSNKLLVRFCWGWILLVSFVTIVHSIYRSWLIAQGLSGNEVVNLLNPNQWNDPEYVKNAIMSYSHLLPGIVIYLFGPIQFIDSLRKNHKRIHKWSGYIFVFAILVSGIAGLLMSFIFPVGGASETISSTLFSLVMIFSVARALYFIIKRNINLHREWMIRAYMISLGPGTMHFIIPFFIQIGGKDIGEALSLSLWLGFTIHLILAEVWIRSLYGTKKKNKTSRKIDSSERQQSVVYLGARYEIRV